MATHKRLYAKRYTLNLKNKRVLITAGPTWVPIDSVRVISNIATGETGLLLAQQAKKQGAKVTLMLGPVSECCLDKAIRIIRFIFFDELRDKIIRELSLHKYDAIIHSAAVSDFGPEQFRGKIDSDKIYDLKLRPLAKIIQDIRHLAPKAKLIMFKLESGICDAALIKRARQAQVKAKAEFIIANRLKPYRAFLIDKEGKAISLKNKGALAKRLLKVI